MSLRPTPPSGRRVISDPQTRHSAIVDVHVVLYDGGRVLLGRRHNTGFADGLFHLPAGHLERGESVVAAAIREAHEELGVALDAADLELLHVMHSAEGRVALFFGATHWNGAIENREPHKCRDLNWFGLDELPKRMVPYARTALEAALLRDERLSVIGWA
jgi:8-oxo-dGTP diphosphatase